jgi:hypothetical protein
VASTPNIILGNRQVIVDRTFYHDAVDDAAQEGEAEAMLKYLQRVEAR